MIQYWNYKIFNNVSVHFTANVGPFLWKILWINIQTTSISTFFSNLLEQCMLLHLQSNLFYWKLEMTYWSLEVRSVLKNSVSCLVHDVTKSIAYYGMEWSIQRFSNKWDSKISSLCRYDRGGHLTPLISRRSFKHFWGITKSPTVFTVYLHMHITCTTLLVCHEAGGRND